MTRAREVAVALVVAAGIGTGLAAQGGAASRGELDALAQEVDRVESLRRIKDLDRTFAQLAQFGEFKKMASLFAADGTLQWGTEVATGGNAIENWLTTDAGAMNGIAAGSLNFMIIDNPSISLAADGRTAKGRWNGLRFMGDGKGGTRIAGGIYENQYVLENGSWRFAKLRYWRQFDGDYEKGWRNADNALLPVVPYHFTPDSVGVPIPAPSVPAPRTSQRAEDLFGRIQALNDEDDVRNLQHSYGAYVDRRMWSDVVDLFAAEGTLQIAGVGTFKGSAGIRQTLEQTMGPEGLAQFILNEHPLWDTIVEVQPGGKTATARGMEYAMVGNAKREASWSFSVFRNTFVREDGLWKIKDMSITPLITANWADGWGKGGIGPQVHYDPPAFLDTSRKTRPANPPADLADLRRRLARSHAWDGSENVNNSYGFFFDDLDCGQLGQIYARQGFKESPFQGFFRTPDRIAEACRVAWGRNQPEMRPSLSYHWQPQPVILVSHDGRSTRSRSRLFQPGTSRNFARGFSGAIYNSQFVLENGVWKFWDTTIDEHYYTSSLARSWSAAVPRDPSSPTPPPSANIAKYAPDLLLTDMNEREIGFRGGVNPLIVWPDIIPMWFNHRNLVTGRVPQYYQPDCTPCGVKPSWSMLQFGYQLPPNGPHIDGVETFPKMSRAPATTTSTAAGQAPFVQNSRVTVWDVAPGAPAPATPLSHDVVTFVIRGDASNAQGTVVFRAKGASPQPVPADARTVVIELQDVTVPPLANSSGQPLAFPRPGIKKLLENDRVVVWSYTWTPGVVLPMHFHDKDAVAVFLADGVLSGTDEKGETGTSAHHFGLIRANTRGRQHTEMLASGQASALILELK